MVMPCNQSSCTNYFNSLCETLTFCTSENDCAPVTLTLSPDAMTSCTNNGLQINYSIDLNNDTSIDESGMAMSVTGTYPLGTHLVTFIATDNCNNEETCSFLFIVEDCTPPIISTNQGLSIEVNPVIPLSISVTELDNGSSDNCGIQQRLLVYPSQGEDQINPPSEASETIDFSGYCLEHLGTKLIDFWVSDAAGNWSYVITYFFLPIM